jgi:small nuclear ribonucleoprotein (snRNP)-like protein
MTESFKLALEDAEEAPEEGETLAHAHHSIEVFLKGVGVVYIVYI